MTNKIRQVRVCTRFGIFVSEDAFFLFQILQTECGKWQNLTLKILCQGACQLLGSCSASRDADGK